MGLGWRVGVVGVLAVVLGSTCLVGSASAGGDDGLWYIDDTSVTEAWKTTKGEGVTIAIIDWPINLDAPELKGADITPMEPSECETKDGKQLPVVDSSPADIHGTEMAAMVVGNGKKADGSRGPTGIAPKAKILYYSVATDEDPETACYKNGRRKKDDVSASVLRAIDDGADIISISIAANLTGASMAEAVVEALKNDVIIVSGARYFEGETSVGYPAGNNGVVGVHAIDKNGKGQEHAVGSDQITITAPGINILTYTGSMNGASVNYRTTASGSSLATPYTSGALALTWSKHPEAKANQILASLIRNTDTGTGTSTPHEPTRVSPTAGYGAINITALLKDDPTTYNPTYNPLLLDNTEGTQYTPDFFDLKLAGVPLPTEEPEPTAPTDTATKTPTPSPTDENSEESNTTLIIMIIVAAVLLAAGITLTAIIITKRRNTPPTPHQPWQQPPHH